MPPKPGKPYQSQLNAHLAEIAALRKTKPYPTPYKKIAEILKAKYGLEISANSIWSFVRSRTPGHGRPLKYRIAEDLIKPPAAAGTALAVTPQAAQASAPADPEEVNERVARLLEEREREREASKKFQILD